MQHTAATPQQPDTHALELYRRERVRTLERRVDGLLRYREQQEQVLALAVRVLEGLTGISAIDWLEVLDTMNAELQTDQQIVSVAA